VSIDIVDVSSFSGRDLDTTGGGTPLVPGCRRVAERIAMAG
jgi:hypothetical protein